MTPPVQNRLQNYGEVNTYANQYAPVYPNNMPVNNNRVNQSFEYNQAPPVNVGQVRARVMTPSGGDGFVVGVADDEMKQRKNVVKNQFQRELMEQIEEKKRAKEEEKRRRDAEELEEERRIQKEREQMEGEFKREQDKKKKEIQDLQMANQHIIDKNVKKGPKQETKDEC